MEAIKLFESKYPNIKVKEQFGEWAGFKKRMNMKIAGNDEPDLMQINYDWLENYSKDGKGFYNLNELSDIIDLNNFSEEILSYGTKNNILNAIPIAMNGKSLYYNEDINKKFSGSHYATWDDIIAAGNKSTGEEYLLAEDAFNSWTLCMGYMEQKTGKSFIDYDGNLNYTQDDIRELLNFYKTLLDQKVFVASEVATNENNMFYDSKSAIAIGWTTEANKIESKIEGLGNESGVDNLPTIQGKDPIKYVKPSALYAANENKDNVTDILLSPYYENSLIKEICQEAIKEIALGKSTPETCAATTYDQLLKTLNTIKVK